jgi:hypothetical protein
MFSPPCHWLNIPSPQEGPPLPGTTRLCQSGEGSHSPHELRRWVPVAQRKLERFRNQLGSPTHQTGNNLGSNSGLSQKAEGESDQLSKVTLVTTFWGWNHAFRVQGAEWKYCAVWEYMKVQARDVVWLRSECGVPIHRCVVNSYALGWALTGPLVWGLYGLTTAKRHLNPCEGSSGRWLKWVVLFEDSSHWDPNDDWDYQLLEWYQRHY